MLDGLFVTPAVTAITEALASANVDRSERVAVVGNAKIATALAAERDVLPIAMSPRAAKQLANTLDDLTTVEAGSLAAVIGVGIAEDDAWLETLRGWSRIVRDGGAIVIVDKGHAQEASRRVLCAGLSELEQRHAGRSVVTSGLVTHL